MTALHIFCNRYKRKLPESRIYICVPADDYPEIEGVMEPIKDRHI